MSRERKLVERYRREAADPDGSDGESFKAGPQAVSTLDLRFQDGRRLALPYSTIAATSFDPQVGIQLEHITYRVTIKGRNLAPLYHQLARRMVLTIVEQGDFEEGDETGTAVSAITVVAAGDAAT